MIITPREPVKKVETKVEVKVEPVVEAVETKKEKPVKVKKVVEHAPQELTIEEEIELLLKEDEGKE